MHIVLFFSTYFSRLHCLFYQTVGHDNCPGLQLLFWKFLKAFCYSNLCIIFRLNIFRKKKLRKPHLLLQLKSSATFLWVNCYTEVSLLICVKKIDSLLWDEFYFLLKWFWKQNLADCLLQLSVLKWLTLKRDLFIKSQNKYG